MNESDPEAPRVVPKQGKDYVPLPQKLAFGMGVVADHYATVCLIIFFMPFFSDFLKVSAFKVGLVMALARLWDAFTDPIVGTLSDRCRSRFGRRKPFIFVGILLTGLFFPVIWMVPIEWSENLKVAYLCGALLIYYSCYSVFAVPYVSLGTELTPDYQERTNVYVVRSYIKEPFNLGIIWVFPLATFLASFPAVGTEVNGVRIASIAIAVMIMVAGVFPALFCVERYREIAKTQPDEKFWHSVRSLVGNRPLLIVIGVIATYLLAIMSTMVLAYYVNTYYIYGGEIHEGAKLGAYDGTLRFSFALFGAYLTKRLSERFDKHHLMMGCVALLFVAFFGMYFTHIPGRPFLTLTMKPLLAMSEAGFWILIISMKADVCDWDEYQSGRRREGLISAATNWNVKMAITMANVLGGWLLTYFVKFDSNLGGDQAPGTMDRLLNAYIFLPCAALVLCFLMLRAYPLTQKRLKDIRETLEERRGETL